MSRILVVEDSPTQAAQLCFTLEGAGFDVTAVESGPAALDLVTNSDFDVVISDILMPGQSGYDLCRAIKTGERSRETPVILLSSLNDPMDIIRGLECGADNFLTKPCAPDLLLARVHNAISNRRVRARSRAKLGIDVVFLGKTFTIDSDKEQILDLLISTFEDIVHSNRSLRESEAELAAAKAKIEDHVRLLEDQVRKRTAELAEANAALQAENTERIQIAESLRESNELLQAIITSSPLAIYLLNPDGKVTIWNAAAEHIFGYTAAEAIGRIPPFIDDSGIEAFQTYFRHMSQMASVEGMEFRHRRKDGSAVDLNISWAPIGTDTGQLRGVVHLVVDMTARKALEHQLSHSQKMEAVGQLTGGIAHDFNNLLSVIMGNLELLQEEVQDGRDFTGFVDTALHACVRGAALTRQLLAFSRRQPLQPERIDVNELVTNVTKMLNRVIGENIEVKLVAAPESAPVVADPAQLEAALTNLAVNARHAMPDGGLLTIETSLVRLDESYAIKNPEAVPGDYISLSVTDTGTGMPPDVVDRVFEPFFTTKSAGEGTGLGLSQVYGFVRQSGGHVRIYSEVGVGTTVRIYLPKAGQATISPSFRSDDQGARPQRGNEIILLVEDDKDVRRTVAAQLGSLGYHVLEADSAQSALEILDRSERVDLLFTDIVMPGGISGIELVKDAAIRYPRLKALLSSGFPGAAIARSSAFPSGVKLLGKPYSRSDLALKVREALG